MNATSWAVFLLGSTFAVLAVAAVVAAAAVPTRDVGVLVKAHLALAAASCAALTAFAWRAGWIGLRPWAW